jgi:hypothetical protein
MQQPAGQEAREATRNEVVVAVAVDVDRARARARVRAMTKAVVTW